MTAHPYGRFNWRSILQPNLGLVLLILGIALIAGAALLYFPGAPT